MDTVPPVISNLVGPANCAVGNCTTTVTFTATDALSPPATTVCSVNGGTAVACTSPYNITSGLTASGTQSFSVTATDQAGKTSAASTVTWVISLAAPSPSPTPPTFTNVTTANGLVSNDVTGVFVSGNNVYVTTSGGVKKAPNGGGSISISTDGGMTFRQSFNLPDPTTGVAVVGNNIYVATINGLQISNNGGASYNFVDTSSGLGSNLVLNVFAVGNTVYAATGGGLSISNNNGNTFTNFTTANGLGDNDVTGVFVVNNTIYAATQNGISISTDGGNTFTNNPSPLFPICVYVANNNIYAGVFDHVSVSTDGGNTYSNLGVMDNVWGLYVSGNMIYVANHYGQGLSISSDGGNTFINATTANGLGSNLTNWVTVSGTTIYVATQNGLSISQ